MNSFRSIFSPTNQCCNNYLNQNISLEKLDFCLFVVSKTSENQFPVGAVAGGVVGLVIAAAVIMVIFIKRRWSTSGKGKITIEREACVIPFLEYLHIMQINNVHVLEGTIEDRSVTPR